MPSRSPAHASRTTARIVGETLAWLARRGSKRNRDGMAHYGIRAKKVYGVSMATMRSLVTSLGRDHALALALWRTGWHEARILASFVDEPELVSAGQMDRWARAFDNWAICDSVCLHLFDRTPHAWSKVVEWATRDDEFVKRAAFALLAGLAAHDKAAPDAAFLRALPLVRRGATDERNFVKKAVSWALRCIGKRNLVLNRAAIDLAHELSDSDLRSARWVGKDALRELTSPAVTRRLRRSDGTSLDAVEPRVSRNPCVALALDAHALRGSPERSVRVPRVSPFVADGTRPAS